MKLIFEFKSYLAPLHCDMIYCCELARPERPILAFFSEMFFFLYSLCTQNKRKNTHGSVDLPFINGRGKSEIGQEHFKK